MQGCSSNTGAVLVSQVSVDTLYYVRKIVEVVLRLVFRFVFFSVVYKTRHEAPGRVAEWERLGRFGSRLLCVLACGNQQPQSPLLPHNSHR